MISMSLNHRALHHSGKHQSAWYFVLMTVADIDIWRAANLLLKQQGKEAPIVAAHRARQCMASGDVDGLRLWKRIAEAMLELLKDKPSDGEHVN